MVKNPTLKVSTSGVELTVGESATIKATPTPSNAKVTYTSADKSIATVSSKGVVTAVGAGTTAVVAKATYGTKTVKKTVSVFVSAEVAEGITEILENETFPENYPGVVVTNPEINKDNMAIFKVQFGRGKKAVNNEYISFKYSFNGGKTWAGIGREKTDVNGIAYFDVSTLDGAGRALAPTKVTYVITPESDPDLAKEGTFSLAKVSISPVQNVNGANGNDKTNANGLKLDKDYIKLGFGALKPSTNDKSANGSTDPLTTTAGTYTKEVNGVSVSDPQYVTEYVNSQQVDNQVGFRGGVPTITLPGDGETLLKGQPFTQAIEPTTSGEYGTYANKSQIIKLEANPAELTYATLNFASLKLSKYTKLTIEEFASEADAKNSKNCKNYYEITGAMTQDNFHYQIPLKEGLNTLYLKLTLKSAGQVNTDTNKGYVVSNITGVYKDRTNTGNTTEPLKGAKVTWSAVAEGAKYSEEQPLNLTSGSDTYKRFAADTVTFSGIQAIDCASKKEINKFTYSVPVFPYTGNAIIKAYDKNGNVLAYFACPTVNERSSSSSWTNKNVLNVTGAAISGVSNALEYNRNEEASWIYRISEEEAKNIVGVVKQEGDLVTVTSTKAGTTVLAGKVEGIPNLDATNDTVYTSVQWNPVVNEKKNSGAIAFAGQEVTLTAQLVDKESNAVAEANQSIDFVINDDNGDNNTVSLLGKKTVSTDSKGQAKLTVCASGKDLLKAISVKSNSSNGYSAVLLVNGVQIETLDLYWINTMPAFKPSAVSNSAVNTDEDGSTYAPATAPECVVADNGVVTDKAIALVGEKWEYGFTTTKDLLVGGTWNGKKVTIKNAKIAVTADSDNNAKVENATDNGSVYATSNVNGVTTLSAIVDGSAYDANGVIFDVEGVGETKSVADAGATANLSNNELKLNIQWGTDGEKGSFVQDLGFKAVTGTTIDLYYKLTDKLGNGLKDKKVTIQVDNGVISGTAMDSGHTGIYEAVTTLGGVAVSGSNANATTGEAVTLGNGLIRLPVAQNASQYKTVVTITYDKDIIAKEIITWNTSDKAPALAVNTGATIIAGSDHDSTNNPYTTYADDEKIVLTFNDNILASSVKLDQFTVERGGDKQALKDVKVSGKTITLYFRNKISDADDKLFDVTIGTKTLNGVEYKVTSTNGAVINSDSITGIGNK